MKKYLIPLLGLLICSWNVYADTINCPQVSGTINYGDNIQNGGLTWSVWIQGSQSLQVNTAADPYYQALPPNDDTSTISCGGGWNPSGNYTQYSFSYTYPTTQYTTCTMDGELAFNCSLTSNNQLTQ